MMQNQTDILQRLDAMKAQEDTTGCFYLNMHNILCGDTNEACRKSMVTWLTQVQTALSLSPESVWVAMSFFDRYLSSGRGNSHEALTNKRLYQLAAITSFYTAIKISEPVVLGIDMLVQICRGTYKQSDIINMENDILSALNWRVSGHTPMDFARHLLELLTEQKQLSSHDSDSLLEICQKHVDFTISDIYFSSCTPSTVGISCLASSLVDCRQRHAIWATLSELCQFDLLPNEVIVAQQRLWSHFSPPCKKSADTVSKMTRKLSSSQSNVAVSSYGGADDVSLSSPICVIQTARQA